jgi:hypothetical protein
LANEVLSSSLEKIKKGEANEKWHYKAAQSAFVLGKYEDSDRLLKEGLAVRRFRIFLAISIVCNDHPIFSHIMYQYDGVI